MNFKTSEINKWYKTKSGVINSKLIINAINKVFYPSSDKKIIYFGPNSIIKKIMNENYSFNSFFISNTNDSDIKAEIQKLPLQDGSIDFVVLIHSLDMEKNPHAAFREIDRKKQDNEYLDYQKKLNYREITILNAEELFFGNNGDVFILCLDETYAIKEFRCFH